MAVLANTPYCQPRSKESTRTRPRHPITAMPHITMPYGKRKSQGLFLFATPGCRTAVAMKILSMSVTYNKLVQRCYF